MNHQDDFDPYQFDAEVIAIGDKSILFEDDCGDEHWIPKKTILDGSDFKGFAEEGEVGTVIIPIWLARKKGMVD